MREPHIIRCPVCQAELCAALGCGLHGPEMWVALHAEALEALLLLHASRDA
jgi:hypothetical protein